MYCNKSSRFWGSNPSYPIVACWLTIKRPWPYRYLQRLVQPMMCTACRVESCFELNSKWVLHEKSTNVMGSQSNAIQHGQLSEGGPCQAEDLLSPNKHYYKLAMKFMIEVPLPQQLHFGGIHICSLCLCIWVLKLASYYWDWFRRIKMLGSNPRPCGFVVGSNYLQKFQSLFDSNWLNYHM